MRTKIKTCYGCKALKEEQGAQPSCALGFKITQLNITGHVIGKEKIGPTGEDGRCPKPKTYGDLIWWKKQVSKTRAVL